MKKNIIILFCFFGLTLLFPACRKKSKSEKQREKATKNQMMRRR